MDKKFLKRVHKYIVEHAEMLNSANEVYQHFYPQYNKVLDFGRGPARRMDEAFQKVYKLSIRQCLTHWKVLAMKQALKTTKHQANVILLDHGFRPDSGARFFRKQTGMTMREYRANAKK